MIVRRLAEVAGTEREVKAATWISRRLLLASDGLGFSLHDTLVKAGTSTEMWYRHHVEAVYCVAGRGSIVNLADGAESEISPGTLYALYNHASVLIGLGEFAEASALGREVYDSVREVFPPEHPMIGNTALSCGSRSDIW